MSTTLSRRALIRLVAGGAFSLALGRHLPAAADETELAFAPNAYLRIAPSGAIEFWIKKCEMGQQIHTAIAAMVADELGADLANLTLIQAPTEARFGTIGTGGSYAVPGFWQAGRPLLAAAREMLEAAAAERWAVPASELQVADGWVSHAASCRRLGLGELCADAARQPVPQQPRLRGKNEWRYVGRTSGRRDARAIVSGSAQYGADVRLPGLRFAAIAKSPTFAGTVAGFDREAAMAVSGVDEVVVTQTWVAVVARNSWAAQRGRDRLAVRWDTPAVTLGDAAAVQRTMAAALTEEGKPVREAGEALDGSALERLRCIYSMPMAQHAALEPVNATALVADGRCTVWAPLQMATQAQQEVAAALGLATEAVTVHTTLLGGAFGRKLERGYAVEAALIVAAIEGPVQLLYSREDDMTQGGVRPPSAHRFDFSIDPATQRIGLCHHYAIASPFAQQDPAQLEHRGFDWTGALGAADIPYAFAHLQITQRDVTTIGVPLNWWRGTFRNHQAFASECAIDELAAHLGTDPLALRLRLLEGDLQVETFPNEISHLQVQRLRAVLQRVAEAIDYAAGRPAGRAVGLACHSYSDVGTYVAHALEVSVVDDRLHIHRVVAAVDCGVAICPDAVRAQMEGSVVFGLSSALWGEVELAEGAIVTANFDRCRLLRMNQTPPIEVIIVASEQSPGGMGEPPLPSLSPALLNAIARAGGPRIRDLPIGNRLRLAT